MAIPPQDVGFGHWLPMWERANKKLVQGPFPGNFEVVEIVRPDAPPPSPPPPTTTMSSFCTSIKSIANLFSSFSSSFSLFSRLLPSAIKSSTSLHSIPTGQKLHALSIVTGLSTDPFVESSLLHMYLKLGTMTDARQVFVKMTHRNVISWSAIIAGYTSRGCIEHALGLLEEMRIDGVEPNLITWNGMICGFNRNGYSCEAVSVLKRMHFEGFGMDGTSISSGLSAVGDLEDVIVGGQIHGYVIKVGFELDGCVQSAFIDMYGKCGCVAEILQVFDESSSSMINVGSCNALLTGLSRNGLAEEALDSFKRFQEQGVELNVVSWTSIVACCAQNGKDMEALALFREMQAYGVKPNLVTIPCMLPACANISALTHGRSAHCFALRRKISNDVYVGSALIDMYAKCGKIKEARTIFDAMPCRNVVSWNVMVGGYAMHGKAKDAIELFELMKRSMQKPDFITLTCVLSACSQAGLTEEGKYYVSTMNKDFKIVARMEHYACVVSLLGRSGKLEEAYELIQNMPFDPDACIWGALLSSCRVHGNLTLGEIAAEKLFDLEPGNAGNYVLLSNMYASKGIWSGVDSMRNKMMCMGMKKDPGYSWIEVKNKVHMLLAGDKSHPQMGEIIERLEKLNAEMRRLGYSPSTDFVLQDVEEQEKEHILYGHSEKLALAFGLLNTSPGTCLRVIKNLRICGDCHTFMKFVSSFERREIFVRDTNRFHHFRDGCCSCGDYW